MSDASNNIDALDPQRPWITDARQLPSRMNWLDAMFNPTGKSPKLHFTRVWTVCFFLQLLIVVVPFGVGIVASLAGGDPKPIQTFGVYATPIVFIVTTYISFVAHSRRLNDAGKTSILAVLVLLPLLAGMALSFMGIMKSAEAYDKLYAERAIYLENPDAWRAELHVPVPDIDYFDRDTLLSPPAPPPDCLPEPLIQTRSLSRLRRLQPRLRGLMLRRRMKPVRAKPSRSNAGHNAARAAPARISRCLHNWHSSSSQI